MGDEPPASLLSASSAHEVQPLHCKPVHTRLGAEAPHAQGALVRLGVCRLVAIEGRGGTPRRLWSLFRSVHRPLWRGGSVQTGAADQVCLHARHWVLHLRRWVYLRCIRGGCKFPATVPGEAEFSSPSR